MVEIADVRDRESLQAYLETLGGDRAKVLTSRRVAFLAAARVLPMALQYFLNQQGPEIGDRLLSTCGALAISGVASVAPQFATLGRGLKVATGKKRSSDTVRDDMTAIIKSFHHENPAANLAAESAVRAVGGALSVVLTAALFENEGFIGNDPSRTAALATSNAATAVDIWHAVRADFQHGVMNTSFRPPGLWDGLDEPDDLRAMWEAAKGRMEADGPGWSFWILWYERVRAGRDFHADKLAEILNTLDEDDWNKGPAHINPLFDDLLALYREEDAELDALRNEARALLAERPTTTTIASLAQRSHNMPPELVEVEARVFRDTEIIWNDIVEAKRELDEPNPDKSRLRAVAIRLRDLVKSTIAYCAKVADTSILAAAKVGGGAAGTFILDHFINSGRLMNFIERLLNFAG